MLDLGFSLARSFWGLSERVSETDAPTTQSVSVPSEAAPRTIAAPPVVTRIIERDHNSCRTIKLAGDAEPSAFIVHDTGFGDCNADEAAFDEMWARRGVMVIRPKPDEAGIANWVDKLLTMAPLVRLYPSLEAELKAALKEVFASGNVGGTYAGAIRSYTNMLVNPSMFYPIKFDFFDGKEWKVYDPIGYASAMMRTGILNPPPVLPNFVATIPEAFRASEKMEQCTIEAIKQEGMDGKPHVELGYSMGGTKVAAAHVAGIKRDGLRCRVTVNSFVAVNDATEFSDSGIPFFFLNTDADEIGRVARRAPTEASVGHCAKKTHELFQQYGIVGQGHEFKGTHKFAGAVVDMAEQIITHHLFPSPRRKLPPLQYVTRPGQARRNPGQAPAAQSLA